MQIHLKNKKSRKLYNVFFPTRCIGYIMELSGETWKVLGHDMICPFLAHTGACDPFSHELQTFLKICNILFDPKNYLHIFPPLR